jgi:hypothetical protein
VEDCREDKTQTSLASVQRADCQVAQARARLAKPLSVTSALFGDAVRAAQANDITAREQLNLLADLILRFPTVADSLLRLHKQVSALGLLLLNAQNAPNSSLWSEVAEKLATSIGADTAAILSTFSSCEYPFRHACGNVLLSDFLCDCRRRLKILALFSIVAGASFGGR